MSRSCCRLAFALALLALPASAQAPEQAAAKAVKARVKTALANVKAAFKEAAAGFDDAVDEFVDVALNTSDPAAALEGLTEAWGVTHAAMFHAVVAQNGDLLDSTLGALGDYQAAVEGDFGGPYADVFLPGAGKGFDDFISGWRRELARAEAKLGAKLGKLRKKLAAGGRDFLVATRPMVLEPSHVLNADGSGFGGFSNSMAQGLEIQLAVSLSIVGGAGQPSVGLAGGGLGNSPIHVTITASMLDTVTEDVTSSFEGQWSFVAPALHVGNYSVTVGQASDDQTARAPLGVR